MKNTKKILTYFLIGVGIGNIIEIFMSLFYGKLIFGVPSFIASRNSELEARIIENILYGGFGIVSFFTEKISYENLFKNTFIHLLTMTLYFSGVGFYLRWFDKSYKFILSLGIFFIIYFIIWYIIYLSFKHKIDKFNQSIKEK